MKVIFLDIDGVLNHADTFKAEELRSSTNKWSSMLDTSAVQRLDRIIRATDAYVVLSSSWRYIFSSAERLAELQGLLAEKGFSGTIIDRTLLKSEMHDDLLYSLLTQFSLDSAQGAARGLEIAAWIRKHALDSFVILDDDNDFPNYKDHLVKTTWEKGLEDHHAQAAIEILQRVEGV